MDQEEILDDAAATWDAGDKTGKHSQAVVTACTKRENSRSPCRLKDLHPAQRRGLNKWPCVSTEA